MFLFDKLARQQVQEQLNNVAELIKKQPPKSGWIQMIRTVLGMSTRQLAKRMKTSQTNVIQLEKSERKGTITLKSLNEAAQAMNCRVVYFFMPLKSLEEIIEDQARQKAKKHIAITGHTMALENQALTIAQLKQEEDELIKKILENKRKLWDDADDFELPRK